MPINRQWVLRHRPTGAIGPDDLELIESVTPELQDGGVLVRNISLSLDPTNRIWMSDQDQYLPPVQIGLMKRPGLSVSLMSAITDHIAACLDNISIASASSVPDDLDGDVRSFAPRPPRHRPGHLMPGW